MTTREAIEYLIGGEKSTWYDDALFRKNNKYWQNNSFKITLKILKVCRDKNISKDELCLELEIPLYTLDKMFKGYYNYSLEEIGRFEKFLNIKLIDIV